MSRSLTFALISSGNERNTVPHVCFGLVIFEWREMVVCFGVVAFECVGSQVCVASNSLFKPWIPIVQGLWFIDGMDFEVASVPGHRDDPD